MFERLLNEMNWQQLPISMFGKTMLQPRLVAWRGEEVYTYSRTRLEPLDLEDFLLELKLKVEKDSGYEFNHLLLNRYRDGNDSMGWHADDEKELGGRPIIASLNLGESREIHFKNRHTSNVERLLLKGGSLMIMGAEVQNNWKHALPKTKRKISERINITFRNIFPYLRSKHNKL